MLTIATRLHQSQCAAIACCQACISRSAENHKNQTAQDSELNVRTPSKKGFIADTKTRYRDEEQGMASVQIRGIKKQFGSTQVIRGVDIEIEDGQFQRVAMGRAIVRDPQVFLFDEPLSNLDANLRVQMRTEIKELHQRLKTTSVYVTHDQIEAMTMADQIVVMRDGLVEQRGRPLELYDRPANIFVAGFIGSPAMNFIPATLRRNADKAEVEFADGTRLPAPYAHRGLDGIDGQRVIYGVRPEHLSIGPAGSGMSTKVVVVEPTGADTEVYARFNDTSLTSIFRERHNFGAGDTINLVPEHGSTHLFDADSGKTLARD